MLYPGAFGLKHPGVIVDHAPAVNQQGRTV